MKTEPRLTDQERQTLLRNLTDVGSSKLIGYLPLFAIKDFLQTEPETISALVANQGLTVAQFGPETCCIKSGALYVYHRERLANFLRGHANVLSAAGLSVDPDQFVERIASVWFEKDHPACSIIAAAFNINAD